LFEANRVRGYAKHPIPLLANPSKLLEGADYARHFIRNRVPVRSGFIVVEAQGTDSLQAVVIARPDGTARRRIPCDPLPIRYHLTPDTLICRCEEVPAHAITEAVETLGAADARTVKLLTRAGMGWCQGRVCGYAVACMSSRDATAPTPTPTDLLAAAKRPLSR